MFNVDSTIEYVKSYIPSTDVINSIDKSEITLYPEDIEKYYDSSKKIVRYRRPFLLSHIEQQECTNFVPTVLLAKHIDRIWHLAKQHGLLKNKLQIKKMNYKNEDMYEISEKIINNLLSNMIQEIKPASKIIFGYPELYLRLIRSHYLMENFSYGIDFVFDIQTQIDLEYHKQVQPFLKPHWSLSSTDRFDLRLEIEQKFWKKNLPEKIYDELYRQVGNELISKGPFRIMQNEYKGIRSLIISRPWGRDMAYSVCKKILSNSDLRGEVYFWGGSGFLDPNAEMEDLLLPTKITSIEGSYECRIIEFRNKDKKTTIKQGRIYNVDSHLDESEEFLIDLQRKGYSAVEMELYGLAKACFEMNEEAPMSILYSMDTPLSGIGLMDTYYRPEKLGNLITLKPRAEDKCMIMIFNHIYGDNSFSFS